MSQHRQKTTESDLQRKLAIFCGHQKKCLCQRIQCQLAADNRRRCIDKLGGTLLLFLSIKQKKTGFDCTQQMAGGIQVGAGAQTPLADVHFAMLEEAPEQSTENNGAEIVRCELNGFAESLEHLRVRELSATSTQPQDR